MAQSADFVVGIATDSVKTPEATIEALSVLSNGVLSVNETCRAEVSITDILSLGSPGGGATPAYFATILGRTRGLYSGKAKGKEDNAKDCERAAEQIVIKMLNDDKDHRYILFSNGSIEPSQK